MERPQSISMFERLYLGSVLASLVGGIWAIIHMPQMLARAMAQASAQGMDPNAGKMLGSMASGAGSVGIVMSLAVSAVIWYLIAKKGGQAGTVGKWIEVVLAAFATFGLLSGLVGVLSGLPTADPIQFAFIALSWVLQIGALYFVFRPDSKPWFDA